MTPRSASLEHRLRRWLRLYPVDQREEMLGVLLATAGPGQERTSPRDAADLVRGAVRVRLQREVRSLDGPVWRDAFAVLSVVTTALLATGLIAYFRDEAVLAANGVTSSSIDPGSSYMELIPEPAQVWAMWAPWPAVAALSLLRLSRTAAILAWAATLSQIPWLAVAQGRDAISTGVVEGNLLWFGLAILAATALSLSDGLRPGLSVLGRWRGVVLLAGVTAFAYTLVGLPTPGTTLLGDNVVLLRPVTVQDPAWLLGVESLLLITAACAWPRSASGRRSIAAVLLALSPFLWSIAQWTSLTGLLAAAIDVIGVAGPLVLIALMGGALASRLRGRRHSTS
ncbi:hypothetical protein [Actinoallomurus sp. NPDC050550]|uniref:hypothetical protein n=1 Tax=Actinoallomurus sp. NPDC050550 TaxID=3154937 RepID=UPI0033CA4B72